MRGGTGARGLARRLQRAGAFFLYAWWRFERDGCLRLAAGLSYATLLSLVPLISIALAILAAFPAFEAQREELKLLIFAFLPAGDGEATRQLESFLANARALTGVGVLGLAVTALLLLWNIHGAINAIWRVGRLDASAGHFLAYWTVITLGPLLLALSLSLSSYVLTLVADRVPDGLGPLRALLPRLASLVISVAGLAIFYKALPQRPVALADALLAGLVTAFLLKILQYGFGLYLEAFPSYQALYGALAAVPIFLVFLYLSWSAVLFGAEVAASLPEWQAVDGHPAKGNAPGERLALALSILARLREALRAGEPLSQGAVLRGLAARPEETATTLTRLLDCGLVARSGHRLLLARDLATVTLGDLLEMLDLGLAPGAGWQEEASRIVTKLESAAAPLAARDLESLLPATAPRQDGGP